uniref:(northern house mosquito) hypothetical protein n=1 Tax=Culex pipiens TaxID=7175 RepID=A0A8D8HJG6_CULPI
MGQSQRRRRRSGSLVGAVVATPEGRPQRVRGGRAMRNRRNGSDVAKRRTRSRVRSGRFSRMNCAIETSPKMGAPLSPTVTMFFSFPTTKKSLKSTKREK